MREDLKFYYEWSAIPPDDARVTGKPDDVLLNRREGYEVLAFLNATSAHKGGALKAERLIRTPAWQRSRSQAGAGLAHRELECGPLMSMFTEHINGPFPAALRVHLQAAEGETFVRRSVLVRDANTKALEHPWLRRQTSSGGPLRLRPNSTTRATSPSSWTCSLDPSASASSSL